MADKIDPCDILRSERRRFLLVASAASETADSLTGEAEAQRAIQKDAETAAADIADAIRKLEGPDAVVDLANPKAYFSGQAFVDAAR